jgi:HK97 family phage portal protein
MKKKKKRTAPPIQSTGQKRTSTSGLIWLTSPDAYDLLTSNGGYQKLSNCPEIQTPVNRIADLISSMTIHLMNDTKDGAVRIKNELSKKIDIDPCKFTTRKQFMFSIVRNIMLDGDGNSIVLPHLNPTTGYLEDLEPFDMAQTQIIDEPSGYGYHVVYKGRRYEPDEILHFTDNVDPQKPWRGRGYKVLLSELAKTLYQAQKTKYDLMSSPTPSIIVKVDGLTEEFASKEGRQALGAQYLDSSENGKPWFIPAEAFSVEQIKPLTIQDLAIKESLTVDKRTAAAIFGVPPFFVGEGEFDRDAYNNTISATVLPKTRGIEQELSRKLILSPNWYFRFNPRSLFSYSLTEIAEVAANYVDRAIIDRNEARDWSGLSPRDGLSDLAILENYIPYAKIGDQGKLKQTGGDKNGKNG